MAKPNAGKPKLAAVAAKSDRACSISTGFIGFLFGFVGLVGLRIASIVPMLSAFGQPF